MHALKKETMKRYKWKEKTYLLKRKEFLEHYLINGFFPTLSNEDIPAKIKESKESMQRQ